MRVTKCERFTFREFERRFPLSRESRSSAQLFSKSEILFPSLGTRTVFNFYCYRYDLYRNSEELFAEASCSQRGEIKRKRYRRKRAGGNAR